MAVFEERLSVVDDSVVIDPVMTNLVELIHMGIVVLGSILLPVVPATTMTRLVRICRVLPIGRPECVPLDPDVLPLLPPGSKLVVIGVFEAGEHAWLCRLSWFNG